MPSKRKRSKRVNKRFKAKEEKADRSYIKPLLVLGVLVIVFVLVGRTKLWDSDRKLSVVVSGENSVNIYAIDPVNKEIKVIKIPQETEVEVAKQLGTWRLGSVWQLGINEGHGGSVLKNTIIKNLGIPVVAWSGADFDNYYNGNIKGILGVILATSETNLSLGDRINIALFSLNIDNFKKQEIELVDTSILKSKFLEDGSGGFIIERELPQNIRAIFSDYYISDNNLRVVIYDHTGGSRSSELVGSTIETLGAKVASVIRKDEEDFDCFVRSNSQEVSNLVASIFDCGVKDANETNSNFDIEIEVGGAFTDRY